MAYFIQTGPQVPDPFHADPMLQDYLSWKIPNEYWSLLEPHLKDFARRAQGEMMCWSHEAETHPPRHIPFDAWGNRIDYIEVSRGWGELHKVAAQDGVVAAGYERKQGIYSRLYQMALLYLFHPSSAFYSCPLAMTDGAARVIEVYGNEQLKKDVYSHLISRDPKNMWTSGQWMTERTGGSDVSNTETVVKMENGLARLHGIKWFTSAVTAEVSLALAHFEEEANMPQRPLSLFCVRLRDQDGRLQNIEVMRLKDKLGTKALPTAELHLTGVPGQLVGERGRGVKSVATMLNITRIYNSVCATAQLARGVQLAVDYSKKRRAFGKMLKDHALHMDTLAQEQLNVMGCFAFVFHLVGLLGKEEMGQASESDTKLLRMLTPVMKLFTGKKAVVGMTEVIESFGGQGYIEDSGLSVLLRDAQVFPIWEGTTNVLSLDLQRAIQKEEAWPVFRDDLSRRLSSLKNATLKSCAEKVLSHFQGVEKLMQQMAQEGDGFREAVARKFAWAVGEVFVASLLLEFAEAKGTPKNMLAAQRWCHEHLTPLAPLAKHRFAETQQILLHDPIRT